MDTSREINVTGHAFTPDEEPRMQAVRSQEAVDGGVRNNIPKEEKEMIKKAYAKYRELQKSGKKGFTLVELIVVLVILAILAAIMIPSMIGWIDKANEKQVTLEARNAMLAVQEYVYEQHSINNTISKADEITDWTPITAVADTATATNVTSFTATNGLITNLVYQNTAGTKKATYALGPDGSGTWTVETIKKED